MVNSMMNLFSKKTSGMKQNQARNSTAQISRHNAMQASTPVQSTQQKSPANTRSDHHATPRHSLPTSPPHAACRTAAAEITSPQPCGQRRTPRGSALVIMRFPNSAHRICIGRFGQVRKRGLRRVVSRFGFRPRPGME